MSTINRKLVRITLAGVVITVIITTALFYFFSREALRRQAYRRLEEEARFVEDLLKNSESMDIIRHTIMMRQQLLSNPLLINRLILIDESRKYIPLGSGDESGDIKSAIVSIISDQLDDAGKYIDFEYGGRKNTGIAYRVRITTRAGMFADKTSPGWLFLYVPLDETKVDTAVLRIFFLSLFISMLIAAGISITFSGRITRPLRQLSEYSSKISERKFDEVKIIRTGDEFEDLSADFADMAEKLRKYDDKQKEFFSIASHNLRTPLMSIKGYAESILDGVAQNTDKALNIIIDESDRLSELIKSILFISKSESVDEFYKFENVSLDDLFLDIFTKVEGIAADSGIRFETDIIRGIRIEADREKLISSIMNIFTNTLRYTDTLIGVRTALYRGMVTISIYDDGKGLAPGEEEKVFERFYKGEKGSFGLGLYITKMIIEKHGGKIRAFNTDKGACFEISLEVVNVSDEIKAGI